LQRGFNAIRDDLGVDIAASLENTKHGSFFVSSLATFSFDPSWAEVELIDFDFSLHRRLVFTEFGDPMPYKCEVPIYRISIQVGQRCGCLGIQIMSKELDNLAEFSL
jgi:hypothetical protein